jgi:dihydroorotate dehydrogenase (NAD+) catalytic subunit
MSDLLRTKFCGMTFQTPLVTAAGTGGYVRELLDVLDVRHLGAITTKSITRESREGNPPWRMIDVPRGMLNAIGLANVGLERFMNEKLPDAAGLGTNVIGSIAGHSVEDYVSVAAAFDSAADLPAVELNVSCPNTSDGLQFGEHPAALAALLREVRPVLTQTKMIVKLSPNVGDILAMARAAVDAGADALTLINTVTAMSVDVDTRRLRLSRGRGGLSGVAVHPIAVRMVYDVYHGVARDADVPIIGLGGVLTWEDAAEFILAGASAVGLGTVLFIDPSLVSGIATGLDTWVARQRCSTITELVGGALPAEQS